MLHRLSAFDAAGAIAQNPRNNTSQVVRIQADLLVFRAAAVDPAVALFAFHATINTYAMLGARSAITAISKNVCSKKNPQENKRVKKLES